VSTQGASLKQKLLNKLECALAAHGFVRVKTVYTKLVADGIVAIEMQASRSSTPTLLKFTINLGVMLSRLKDPIVTSMPRAVPVGHIDCHYRVRIGDFMESPEDKWWIVSDEMSIAESLCQVMWYLTNKAIPYVESMASEASLLALWKTGCDGGLPPPFRHELCKRLEELRSQGTA
jgi:hypothetical protein